MSELEELLTSIRSQTRGESMPWPEGHLDDIVEHSIARIKALSSVRALGEGLRLDDGLELPVGIVIAIYRRLMELGVQDARTVICFARYLLLHGPERDEEAHALLAKTEEAARAAGVWDAAHLGHHPVFFKDSPDLS